MISVDEAQNRIINTINSISAEKISTIDSVSRTLTSSLLAKITHPPADISAMDGYAIRGEDLLNNTSRFKVIGEVQAGSTLDINISSGEAVRIFTGGNIPKGADTVVIQENTDESNGIIEIIDSTRPGQNVRKKGQDFIHNDPLMESGQDLTIRDVGLAVAAGITKVEVRKKPRVGVLFTGNELVNPNTIPKPNQIINSNGPLINLRIESSGGIPIDRGILPDDPKALATVSSSIDNIDLFITVGGASVGKYDLIQTELSKSGLQIDFWKVALRPGKPLMYGSYNNIPMLGLPGNPVSAFVCGILFLRPAIKKLLGSSQIFDNKIKAALGCELKENDERETYLRSKLNFEINGDLIVIPFNTQDSNQISTLSKSDCFAIRTPNAKKASKGDLINIIPFNIGHKGF